MVFQDLKFAFEDLNAEQCEEINKDGDYLKFELHIFNAGGYSTIESCDYSEEAEEEVETTGVLIDKSDFLRLYQESDASNEHLDQYI